MSFTFLFNSPRPHLIYLILFTLLCVVSFIFLSYLISLSFQQPSSLSFSVTFSRASLRVPLLPPSRLCLDIFPCVYVSFTFDLTPRLPVLIDSFPCLLPTTFISFISFLYNHLLVSPFPCVALLPSYFTLCLFHLI